MMRRRFVLALLAVSVRAATFAAAPAYPRPDLTPGAVFASVTAEQVCTPGYSASVRHVSRSLKRAIFVRYGMGMAKRTCCEVDHLISLQLGGSNDVANLWPEPYTPRPGAHEKDLAENYLHREVCHSRMTLQEAQEAIQKDWFAVYQKARKTK